MTHIINSLLDTDYYKFTMGNVAYCQFPDMMVRYKFKWRGPADVKFTLNEKMEILSELEGWCGLRFLQDELDYLRKRNLFSPAYIEFLAKYQPNIGHLKFDIDKEDLDIEVYGPWCQTIFWEIAVLAIVSEVYSKRFGTANIRKFVKMQEEAHRKLVENISIANAAGLSWADFGTRRRSSHGWHEHCVRNAKHMAKGFVGTSNVYFAKMFDVSPIGTMAHEYLSIGQAIVHPLDAQREMLQRWCDQYRGNLGIALTDIVGLNAFLKDFDYYFAKLYDGVRHDSGDPYWWAHRMIRHYHELGIDSKTKTLVFSDGLDFNRAVELHNQYKEYAKVSAGIGTKFTNDAGHDAPQIVMKIVEVNGRPVAKISDSQGKGMCEDAEYVTYIKKIHNIGE